MVIEKKWSPNIFRTHLLDSNTLLRYINGDQLHLNWGSTVELCQKNTMVVARRFVPVMLLVSTDLCDISILATYHTTVACCLLLSKQTLKWITQSRMDGIWKQATN